MGGGLLQLVAYGAQDAYLSGNPQITFWKSMFKRHTNFAMEPFRINFNGQASWGTKHSAVLGRHADLLYSTYLEVVLPPGALFNNDQARLGYNLIRYVELDIGGQLIDRLYGEWLFLWDCLTSSGQQGMKLSRMVAGSDTLTFDTTATIPPSTACTGPSGSSAVLPTVLYIPLTFFYTRNPGAALPLIALQYHEVKITLQWNDATLIAGNFNNAKALPQPVQAAIYIDYIYLDTEERRRMAQQSHEYLIEQTQFNEDKGISSYSNRIDLTFNHPVKELVWVVQPTSYTNCSISKKFGGDRLQPFTYDQAAVFEQWIQFNGQDRLDRRYGDYYNKVQPYQHHTGSFNAIKNVNGYINTGTTAGAQQGQLGAYMYSFALRPEEHQPSGTCNFSRIDTATIVLTMNGSVTVNPDTDNTWNIRVYAVNYNILRIMSGMGGLAYSN
jgi:hypothetical protein